MGRTAWAAAIQTAITKTKCADGSYNQILLSMKRKAFMPPRLQGQPAPVEQQPAAAAPTPAPVAVFDCLFRVQNKKAGTAEGTLVLLGAQGQLLDLQLRKKASGALPAGAAAVLRTAHAAAVAALAAGQPLGPLWQQQENEAPQITLGQYAVLVEDERGAAVQQAEWEVRHRVGVEAKGGKPKDAVGPEIPADNKGAGSRRLMSQP
jgi:hypothetical protein